MSNKNKKQTQKAEQALNAHTATIADNFQQNTQDALDQQMNQPFDFDEIQKEIAKHGTDIEKNKNDPLGDGDQSELRTEKEAQYHRDLFISGGRLESQIQTFPQFILSCMVGNIDFVKKALEECTTEDGKKILLESRYGALRQPPITLTLIGWVTLDVGVVKDKKGYVEVIKLLLEHGARPDARDVCGKTIVHYASGPLCMNPTVLELAELCIQKYRPRSLVDIPDRFGEVPLMHAVMGNRLDIVTFLCNNGADANHKDFHGITSISLAALSPAIKGVLTKSYTKAGHEEFSKKCGFCGNSSPTHKYFHCSRCKGVYYCNRECQKSHWKEHKKQCKSMAESRIILTAGSKQHMTTIGRKSTSGETWSGGPTPNVKVGNEFVVKLQCAGATQPILAYNKGRDWFYHISQSNCEQFDKLVQLIQSFPIYGGQKAYFMARMDDNDHISLNPTMFTAKW